MNEIILSYDKYRVIVSFMRIEFNIMQVLLNDNILTKPYFGSFNYSRIWFNFLNSFADLLLVSLTEVIKKDNLLD